MENRVCRKCGKHIPYSMQVDGKKKSLQNRKFCLECSPWGNHNTKSDDPLRESMPREDRWKRYSEEQKLAIKICLYRKGLERKDKLIEMAGGGCKICGYNKYKRALIFHHRNREEKLFGLSLNNLWSKSWEIVVEEFNKCDLLCSNCHTEIEDEYALKNESYYRTIIKNEDKSLVGVKRAAKQYPHKCSICQKDFVTNEVDSKYCSRECSGIASRKVVRPSKEELEKLLLEKSKCEISRQFGVSDNAVKKWAEKYGIIPNENPVTLI